MVLALALAPPARADSDNLLTAVQIRTMKDCVDQGQAAACVGLFLADCADHASADIAPNALKATTWCLEEEAAFWEDLAGVALTEPQSDACPTNMSEEDQQESWAITMRDNEIAECRRDSFARQALAVLGEGEKLPEGDQFILASVRTCFQQAVKSGDQSCLGTGSARCQSITEGGGTTLGVVDCNRQELAAWELILDEEHKSALRHAIELDAAEPAAPLKAAGAVTQSQQSWQAFRDAQCAMEYAKWGRGTMRNIASSLCELSMTAERAISLRNWYQGEEGVLP